MARRGSTTHVGIEWPECVTDFIRRHETCEPIVLAIVGEQIERAEAASPGLGRRLDDEHLGWIRTQIPDDLLEETTLQWFHLRWTSERDFIASRRQLGGVEPGQKPQ